MDDDETAKMILAQINRSKENAENAYKRIFDIIEEAKKSREESKRLKEETKKVKEFKSLYPEITTDIRKHFEEWMAKGEPKPSKTKKNKLYHEGEIMKGKSKLKKKGDKYSVDTEFNINNDIDDKVKRAFVKSIIEELNKNFDEYEFFYVKKN
jgi:hypothetical protein